MWPVEYVVPLEQKFVCSGPLTSHLPREELRGTVCSLRVSPKKDGYSMSSLMGFSTMSWPITPVLQSVTGQPLLRSKNKRLSLFPSRQKSGYLIIIVLASLSSSTKSLSCTRYQNIFLVESCWFIYTWADSLYVLKQIRSLISNSKQCYYF